MQTLDIEIRNPNGLHLRPLGQFIRTCGRVRSAVTIQNLATGAGPVNAKQMLRVQPLGVRLGHVVRITTEGDDEDEAIATIRAAIEGGLGEEIAPPTSSAASPPSTAAPPPPAAHARRRSRRGSGSDGGGPRRLALPAAATAAPPDPTARRLVGLGAVAGIAIAPAWRYREQDAGAALPVAGDPGAAIRSAATAASLQLEALADRIRAAGQARRRRNLRGAGGPGHGPDHRRRGPRPRRGGRGPRERGRRGRGRGGRGHRRASVTSCSPRGPRTFATSAPASPGSCGARRLPCPTGPSSPWPTISRRRSPPRSRPPSCAASPLPAGPAPRTRSSLPAGSAFPASSGARGSSRPSTTPPPRPAQPSRSPWTARPASC